MPEAVVISAGSGDAADGKSAETVSAVAPIAVDVSMRSGLHR